MSDDAIVFGGNYKPVAAQEWQLGEFSAGSAASALNAAGWKVKHVSDTAVVAKHGSRLQLRILGAAFKRVRENMPVSLRVSFDADEIRAEITPDPGWYLFGFNMADSYARSGVSGFEALNRLVSK